MEVIRIPGYTEDEKIQIARRHLMSKLMKQHGLKDEEWSISEQALRALVQLYTREAGVRNLERELAGLMRKAVKEIAIKKCKKVIVNRRNLKTYAGIERFSRAETELVDLIGVATGLFGSRLRSFGRYVRDHGEYPADAATLARPHGGHSHPRLYRG